MSSLISLASVFFVVVRGDEWGLIHFSKSQQDFRKCFQQSTAWHDLGCSEELSELKDTVYNFARRLPGKTIANERIGPFTGAIVENLISNEQLEQDNRDFTTQVQEVVQTVLMSCSDDAEDHTTDSIYRRPPHWLQEETILGDLIDRILVTWPPPRELLSTQLGLLTIEKFCSKGLLLVYQANSLYGNDNYLLELEFMWSNRAVLYIDGNTFHCYINHTYTMDHPVPYALGDPREFIDRRFVPVDERNPNLPQARPDTLLNLYPENPSADQDQADPVGDRFLNGINFAVFFYEHHRANFFRCLLAYLALLESRNVNNGVYGYVKYASVDDIPEEVLLILSDDTYYREYLLRARLRELEHRDGVNEKAMESLRDDRRVRPEILVVVILKRIRHQIRRSKTTTTTTTAAPGLTTVKRKRMLRRFRDEKCSLNGQRRSESV